MVVVSVGLGIVCWVSNMCLGWFACFVGVFVVGRRGRRGFGSCWEFASLDDLVRTQGGGRVPGSREWEGWVVLCGDSVGVGVVVGLRGVDRVSGGFGGGFVGGS